MIMAQDTRIVKCQAQDPCIRFLQHPACRLCYDEGAQVCADRARIGDEVDFVAVLDQVITLLRQRGRLTYRTLKRQFELDDAALEDLKEELIYGQRLATDEDERVLVWMCDTAATPPQASR